jgi:hypothetical protein
MDNGWILIIGLCTLTLIAIIFAPMLSIWAVNTIFPKLMIPYTFKTWLAALLFPAAGTASALSSAYASKKTNRRCWRREP